MSEYMIQEDRNRLLLYTVLNLLLTVILLVLAAGCYTYGIFILAFITITIIWFSVKAMCRYGSKWIKKTPVCEFHKDGIIIHSMQGKPRVMKYQEIREVNILRDRTSVKLFFAGDQVEHPSGWYYAGVIYFFQRSLLDDVEQKSIAFLKRHNVNVKKIEHK